MILVIVFALVTVHFPPNVKSSSIAGIVVGCNTSACPARTPDWNFGTSLTELVRYTPPDVIKYDPCNDILSVM
jgi:hypothetical protein